MDENKKQYSINGIVILSAEEYYDLKSDCEFWHNEYLRLDEEYAELAKKVNNQVKTDLQF